jgi:hypothetical protein
LISNTLPILVASVAFILSGCEQHKDVLLKKRIGGVVLEGDYRDAILAKEPPDLPSELCALVPQDSWVDSFWIYSENVIHSSYYHPSSGLLFLVVEDTPEGELVQIPRMHISSVRSVIK